MINDNFFPFGRLILRNILLLYFDPMWMIYKFPALPSAAAAKQLLCLEATLTALKKLHCTSTPHHKNLNLDW